MATVFTDAGEDYLADLVDGTIDNAGGVTYFVGWGTGTTAAAVTDTTLETEDTTDGRVSGANSQPTSRQNQVVATITSTQNLTITEAGLFTQDDPGGTMLVRGVFAGIGVTPGDKIEFTIITSYTGS